MSFEPDSAQLLTQLPARLTAELFASAQPARLAAERVLFLASDPGDSCYRVDDGLLKVTMVSLFSVSTSVPLKQTKLLIFARFGESRGGIQAVCDP